MSYVEIYQETIRDLLQEKDAPPLKIRDTQDAVTVSAREIIICQEEMILEAMAKANSKRQVASTSMNERSSRSHTIFRLIVESKERSSKAQQAGGESRSSEEGRASGDGDVDGAVLVGTLSLVDLAGSERVSDTNAVGMVSRHGERHGERHCDL